MREALNFHLRPAPVAVVECALAADDFDARYSATARHYRYRILSRRGPPALERDRVWWLPIALDAGAMHEAAQALVGRHDFTTFRAAQCQANSPLRTLDRLDVSRYADEIVIEASARSFLHNQVRSMVGSLKLVGEGKWRPHNLARRSRRVTARHAARWRRRAGSTWRASTTARRLTPKPNSPRRRLADTSLLALQPARQLIPAPSGIHAARRTGMLASASLPPIPQSVCEAGSRHAG